MDAVTDLIASIEMHRKESERNGRGLAQYSVRRLQQALRRKQEATKRMLQTDARCELGRSPMKSGWCRVALARLRAAPAGGGFRRSNSRATADNRISASPRNPGCRRTMDSGGGGPLAFNAALRRSVRFR